MLPEHTIQTPAGPVVVRRATAEAVVDLRHRTLRIGLPRASAVFPGDERPGAYHVVAEAGGNVVVVGCATVHASEWEGAPAWQLRGMATDPALRGAGVGRAMLTYLEHLLLDETDVRQMWCNARVPAVGFYERLGWRVASDPFEIPTAGPHVRMTRLLSPGAAPPAAG